MDSLVLPYIFMPNAFASAALVAIPTALLSCFLVLKGWSLMGDAISHAILPGVVLAYIFGLPLALGAFMAGLACAVISGYIDDNSRLKSDTVLGVVFSGMFAFGLLLYTSIHSELHLNHILYGDILAISMPQLLGAAGVAALVALVMALRWKDLMLFSFDVTQARAMGLPVGVLHYGLLSLLALSIVATLTSAGLVMAIGLVIAPGAIAFLLTTSLSRMLWIAVGVNVLAGQIGTYASFWLNSAPSATIILVLTLVFLLAMGWRNFRLHHKVPETGR